MENVKIAILGTGNIADIYASTMQKVSGAKVYAVASRSIEKAKEFAKKHNIPKAYGSYLDVLEDKNVSLVYIATPHMLHYEMSKMCLSAGKNVLCEKPVTINSKEAEELFSLAKENNLFFSEAMWTRFLPVVKTVQNMINEGCIGNPKFLTASTAWDSTKNARMTDPNMAGGMLLDCGIYLITSVLLLFGEDIKDLSTDAVLSDKGVDLRSITTLNYSDGKTATMFMSMDSYFENKITVSGDKGYMEIQVPYNWQNIKIYSPIGEVTKIVNPPEQTAGGHEYMIESVVKAILSGKTYCSEATPETTLLTMKIMDKMRNKWGLIYPCETK